MLSVFTFPAVMAYISRKLNCEAIAIIHFDEMQEKSSFAQHVLHVAAEYMCCTDTAMYAFGAQQQISLFPIVTGTSSKSFKNRVTNYSDYQIRLDPFNWKESRAFLRANANLPQAVAKNARFRRFVMSLGGLPRLLELFADAINSWANEHGFEDIDQMLSNAQITLSLNLESAYKISTWVAKFGGLERLGWVIKVCVAGTEVDLSYVVPGGKADRLAYLGQKAIAYEQLGNTGRSQKNAEKAIRLHGKVTQAPSLADSSNVGIITIEDIMKEGVIFLKNVSGSLQAGYYIVIPQIILHMLNCRYNFIPLNLLEPLEGVWNWKKFENFESKLEAVKSTIMSKVYDTTSFGGYYWIEGKRESDVFSLLTLEVATELHQFLPKEGGVAQVPHTILTDKGAITGDDIYKYSFLCAPGTPSADSRVFRKANPDDMNQTPWMIVKQMKHSTSDKSTVTREYMEKVYHKFWGLF
jgi:hypothetical protein